MTEKVKVTHDVSDAIEFFYKKEWKNHEIVRIAIDDTGFGVKPEDVRALKYAPLDNIIRALYIGYEVEPEFKVGDWVVYGHNGRPQKIVRIPVDGYAYLRNYDDDNRVSPATFDYIRHATHSEIAAEKERRWWARHGRDAWELYEGDVIFNKASNELKEITSYRKIDKSILINVICFAENRLDRSDNDE